MRLRGVHRFGVLALYLLAHLGVGACSSSQQQEQGDEVETSEDGEEYNDAAEGGDNETNNTAENSGDEGNEVAANEYGDETLAQGNQTGSDLQEIISEMNQGFDQTTPPAQAETVAEVAPVEEVPAEAAPMVPAPTDAAPVAMGAPAGNGLPEMNSKMPYIVQPGDTLGNIAKKIYGDVSMWRDIKNLSSLQNPSRIYPGDVVYYRLTEQAMAFASAYENQPKAEVTVGQGDTLASIARRMGDHNAWRTIWRLNDSVNNPDNLAVGQTIYHYSSVTGASVDAEDDVVLSSINHVNSQVAQVAAQDNVSSLSVNLLAFASLISANFAG